jgi:hypothetical protein
MSRGDDDDDDDDKWSFVVRCTTDVFILDMLPDAITVDALP